MFNTICPKVYAEMRTRAGLSQEELAKAVGVRRHTVSNFELGRSKPTAEQERKIMKATKCSLLEFAQIACEELGELVKAPIGVREKDGLYEPISLLTRGEWLLREADGEISPRKTHGLQRKITTVRLMAMVFDQENTDLEEHIRDCRDELEKKKKNRE